MNSYEVEVQGKSRRLHNMINWLGDEGITVQIEPWNVIGYKTWTLRFSCVESAYNIFKSEFGL